jgi:NDP-sugar pyrophosphorylase family protein
VQIFEPKVFGYMDASEAAQKFSTTMQTYPKMLQAGEALYGFCFEGFWQDLGTVERIKKTEERLRTGHVNLHYLH